MFDFIDQTFDQALRVFVEESGFKMPVEKLKIERMMKAFCRAYDYQNPGIYMLCIYMLYSERERKKER